MVPIFHVFFNLANDYMYKQHVDICAFVCLTIVKLKHWLLCWLQP